MRNRANQPQKLIPQPEKKKLITKKLFIGISLIFIFFLVLLFNSYFNYQSGIAFNENGTTLGTRFFLSGPDPYYNMRLCQQMLKTGQYPFVTLADGDPLLNYPLGILAGARPPLFNLVAVASAGILQNVMPQMDALGWAMLFLPAIYGALLVFPVYGIGKTLFNHKVGLVAALLVALTPIHISSGHGSAFALFDSDSFVLLLTTLFVFFAIKSFKEEDKKKSFLYATLGSVMLGAIYLSWSSYQGIFLMLALSTIVFLFLNILRCKYPLKNMIASTIMLGGAFFITLPYAIYAQELLPNFTMVAFGVAIITLILSIIFKKLNLPWTITLPTIGALLGAGLVVLYFVNLKMIFLGYPILELSNLIYGAGIYGLKVSLTIAEAHTFGMSQIVMSYGVAVYWLALIGFVFFLYKNHRNKWKDHQTFFIILFISNFWLTTVAGRFLNDLIPQIVIFSAMVIVVLVDKIDYKTMIRNVKNSVGINKLKRIRYTHYLGVMFVSLLVIFPNAYTSLDAAIPPEDKAKYFGENYSGYFGTSLGEQYYWADAFHWLSLQDNEIVKPQDRPAFLSWWDYGFYGVSMGEHPVVADNYQDGFYPASNFLTSQSEMDAISILIIRLAEGTQKHLPPDGRQIPISSAVEQVFRKYFPPYNETVNNTYDHIKFPLKKIIWHYPAEDIIRYMNDKQSSPSYNTLISEEWGNKIYRKNADNAMYQDVSKIITKLDEDKILSLYKDMVTATGYDIRYFGIERRDITDIFGVFTFLSDKSVFGYSTTEDDWYQLVYTDDQGNQYPFSDVKNMTQTEYEKLNLKQNTISKDTVSQSTAYRLFYGIKTTNSQFLPSYAMRHFYVQYLSGLISISKFYEGAKVKGSVFVNNVPYMFGLVAFQDQYGLIHDVNYINYDGSFNLLVPSGNVTLLVLRDNNVVGSYPFDIKITEEQAKREAPCNVTLPIQMNLSSINLRLTNITQTGLSLTFTNEEFFSTVTVPDIQPNVYTLQQLFPATYKVTVLNTNTNTTKTLPSQFLQPDSNNITINVGTV